MSTEQAVGGPGGVSETPSPIVSVVIPTKNGRSTIEPCVEGILSQTLASRLEVIVIDSGSTDGTLEVLKRYPVRVHRIPPDEFNHGDARNLGADLARGDLVALTVQDARPADAQWLERLSRHFVDPRVAGVCGQQIVPHESDKNPLQWFRPYDEPAPQKICFASVDEFERLSPAGKMALCGWDNVTAMYRRSVLQELPFQHVGFAEDLIWAKDALLGGHTLVYDYSARVYHYHEENFAFRFRREFTILYHRYRHFNDLPMPIAVWSELARCAYRAARPKYCPSRRARWLLYNLRLTLAQWSAGSLFWWAAKAAGEPAVRRLHSSLCATPPRPPRSV